MVGGSVSFCLPDCLTPPALLDQLHKVLQAHCKLEVALHSPQLGAVVVAPAEAGLSVVSPQCLLNLLTGQEDVNIYKSLQGRKEDNTNTLEIKNQNKDEGPCYYLQFGALG